MTVAKFVMLCRTETSCEDFTVIFMQCFVRNYVIYFYLIFKQVLRRPPVSAVLWSIMSFFYICVIA